MEYVELNRRCFGPWSRYCLITARDRFGNPHFLVTDAERPDEITGAPGVIRQGSSESEVLAELE